MIQFGILKSVIEYNKIDIINNQQQGKVQIPKVKKLGQTTQQKNTTGCYKKNI